MSFPLYNSSKCNEINVIGCRISVIAGIRNLKVTFLINYFIPSIRGRFWMTITDARPV